MKRAAFGDIGIYIAKELHEIYIALELHEIFGGNTEISFQKSLLCGFDTMFAHKSNSRQQIRCLNFDLYLIADCHTTSKNPFVLSSGSEICKDISVNDQSSNALNSIVLFNPKTI